MKICLDAGHYGKYYNQSPAVKTYYESVMNWNLHLKLKAELEKYGIEVITTRKELDKDLKLVERGKKGKGCDLFLSIHSNAAADNVVKEEIDYPVVYVPINGSGDALGKKLADCIASVMETKQEGKCKSRKGSGDWDYYGVISGAVYVGVPGLILEHSFHTNTRSTKWLMDDSNLDKLAVAEAKVIAEHYGLKKSAETTSYTQKQFVKDVQKVCGAAVDGIAGPETISKTQTLSAKINSRHAAVKPVQMRLMELGYTEVGEADGIAGPKFTSAVAHYQQDNDCAPTGIMEEWGKTWHKLLGMG